MRLLHRVSLVWILISVLSPPAFSAVGGNKLSDEDMRKILLVLFKEVLRADSSGTLTEVFVDPRLNPRWLPRVEGFQLKQLSYEEEKQGSEYYDIWLVEGRDRNAIVSFTKGNYCKKVGRRYKLHKDDAAGWRLKSDVLVESIGGDGQCPGCDLASGEKYSVRRLLRSSPSRVETASISPVLNGRVTEVSCQRIEKPYIRCTSRLDLRLLNNSTRSLVIMQPVGDYRFWHGGTDLALTESDLRAARYVYSSSAWPSIYRFPIYEALAAMLDQPSPPSGVTRVIPPNAAWEWTETIQWSIEAENHCNMTVGVEIGWNALKKLSAPIWLRASFEMWPFNVENFKKDLGRVLRKRWSAYGDLHLDERRDRYSQWILNSEPIELDLRTVALKTP